MTTPVRSFFAAALAVAAGCSDTTGITTADVVGSWNASVIEFTNIANTAQQVELVAAGATLTLVLDAAGTFALTVTPPGGPTDTENGTWLVDDGDLVMMGTVDPDPIRYSAARSGDTLTVITNQAEYDFNGTGDEPARLRMVLVL